MIEIDATGHLCPLPVLRARRALESLGDGDSLRLLATDPGTKKDVPAFCRETGNRLLESGEEAGIFLYVIRKGAGNNVQS